jgi:type VI secretion system ImpC/EvpB family protein
MTHRSTTRKLIVKIDAIVKEQLVAILEHDSFKTLLENWSCLYYLTRVAKHHTIRVKILDIRWCEIAGLINDGNDLDNLLSYKILDELELPGNDPLSMLIGSYRLDVSEKATINILSYISTICAYCFVPFVSSITPDVFDVDEFSQLTKINLQEIHKISKFKNLIEFANNENSIFIGLVIPQIFYPSLIANRDQNHCSILGNDIVKYNNILGNGAYAFAAVIANSFIHTGWFLDIIGVPPQGITVHDGEQFGIVPGIKAQSFFAANFVNIKHIFFKYTTDCFISEHQEKELADLGFIPICHIKGSDSAVFYSNGSIKNLSSKANQQEVFEASTLLQNILCICRFAHYIKIIGRQKLGLFSNVSEFQHYLNNWLLQYVSSDVDTPLHLKHKYPLLEAKVEVFEDMFLRNNFKCKIYLKPHLISSQVLANITLTTQLSSIAN